jgi:hypothetical protein
VSEEQPTKKKPQPGWYPDPKAPNTKRYWTGEGWSEQRYVIRPNANSKPAPLSWSERPEGLMWGSLFLAVGLGIFAGLALIINENAGIIAGLAAVYLTSALFAIGIIAKGVELGIRAARHRQDLDF